LVGAAWARSGGQAIHASAAPLFIKPAQRIERKTMRINHSRRYTAHAIALACGLLAASLTSVGQAPAPTQVAGGFAGNWVEDQSQRKTGALRSLTFRNGANGLEELRGSYARPLVQPVRFGTAPYAVDESKNTLVWKQLGGGRFERTIAEKGQTINVRRITISADGKTLTETTETNLASGKKSTITIVYARTSGSGQDLEGVWKPQTLRSDTPQKMSIREVGSALKVSTEAGLTYTLTFNGKPEAVTGPAVISGTTNAGKIVCDRLIRIEGARMGTPVNVATWTLSADGKTLTTSNMTLGPDASKEPSVSVYLKR
jgi:hypothetical protein